LIVPATFGAAALATSRITIDCSRGVVTQISFERATYATPSGIEESVTQAPRTSVAGSTAHTLESPRFPT
jgi:hypothetical protein